jgi:hypothetical protein
MCDTFSLRKTAIFDKIAPISPAASTSWRAGNSGLEIQGWNLNVLKNNHPRPFLPRRNRDFSSGRPPKILHKLARAARKIFEYIIGFHDFS